LVVADAFNYFEGGLYYFINIAGFVIAFIFGLYAWIGTSIWMRNRTNWNWEEKHNNGYLPIQFAKFEKIDVNKSDSNEISKEDKWRAIQYGLGMGNFAIQTILFFIVSLILMANEYFQFKLYDLPYTTRIFLDSLAFYVAFLYVSRPVFSLFLSLLVNSPAMLYYEYGSFWHKFWLLRMLVVNSMIYGSTVFYSHQLFLTFE
jgi:hypothetical protein